jgi:hypothetical protein
MVAFYLQFLRSTLAVHLLNNFIQLLVEIKKKKLVDSVVIGAELDRKTTV